MIPTRNTATVLVAEDDPEVRTYIEFALRGQGYNIEMADDEDKS